MRALSRKKYDKASGRAAATATNYETNQRQQ